MNQLRTVRYIHKSSCNCLRKRPLFKNPVYENVPESGVSATLQSPPENIGNKNFYGIESDEGVILINEKSPSRKLGEKGFLSNYASKIKAENLKNTSFGNIRWDKENKLMFHGQYEELDHLDDLKKHLPKRTHFESLYTLNRSTVDNQNITKSDNPDSMSQEQSDFGSKSSEAFDLFSLNKNNKLFKSLNVDKNINTTCTKESELDSNSEIAKLSSTSESFIDEMYFSKQTHGVEDLRTVNLENQDFTVPSVDCTSENFIDKVYFPNQSSTVNTQNENLVYENVSNFQESKQSINSSHNSEQIEVDNSFIDKSFFSNKNNEDLQLILPPADARSYFSNDTHEEKRVTENFHQTSEAIKIKQFQFAHTSVSNKDTSKKKMLNSKSPKMNTTVSSTQIKQTTNKNLKSKTTDDQIKTAHDFVTELRREKYPRPIIKNGVIQPVSGEKYDSKGFRILKNQVQSLKYFTREEILTLLKSNVLYSDDDLVVLNKPYNLVMHESQTTSKDACLSNYLDDLAKILDDKNSNPKLLTVHRLDKETTGCLLLARNELTAQRLKTLFAQRQIIKTYWIVTAYVPDPLEGIIDIPIAEGSVDEKSRMVLKPDLPKDINYKSFCAHGKNAVTHYNVIARSGNAALVEVRPETGIKHQIRVHFGFGLQCPILGDHKYSHLTQMVPQKLPSDLLQKLHVRQSKVRHIPMHMYARSVVVPHYREGRNLFVMAPMPRHMSHNLQRLKFRKK